MELKQQLEEAFQKEIQIIWKGFVDEMKQGAALVIDYGELSEEGQTACLDFTIKLQVGGKNRYSVTTGMDFDINDPTGFFDKFMSSVSEAGDYFFGVWVLDHVTKNKPIGRFLRLG
jgi:hypothetical protein